MRLTFRGILAAGVLFALFAGVMSHAFTLATGTALWTLEAGPSASVSCAMVTSRSRGFITAATPCLLILQPLVENAVEHGVGFRVAPGWVRIDAAVHGQGARLMLRGSDSGIGAHSGSTQRFTHGVGLSNTRARPQHPYGSNHRFSFHQAPSGGVMVELGMPLRHAASDAIACHEAREISV